MDTGTPRLEDRLKELSQRLCASLDAVIRSALDAIEEVPGDSLRPVLLTSKLGLDKSLASRVVRAIGADDPIRALHCTPTPQGLALVARAAKDAGANRTQIESMEDASAAYGELLAEFSGGRTDLEATLAGWIPEQRERAERDARRSVFRGMTTLSGTRTSANYNSLYLVPPATDSSGTQDAALDLDYVNSLLVTVRQDLRRLRNGARLHVMSLLADPHLGDDPLPSGRRKGAPQARFTLGGVPLEEDLSALLLRDLCSHPLPELELQQTGERIMVSVHPDSLDVNEFATIGMGWRTHRHFPRYSSASQTHGSISMTASSPSEALVVDLFLHRDLEWKGAPFASKSDGVGRYGPHLDPETLPRAELEVSPAALNLDAHPSGLSSPDVRACGAIAENACREAGYDLADFSKYRFKIAFPTPTEQLTIWWELPKAPTGAPHSS